MASAAPRTEDEQDIPARVREIELITRRLVQDTLAGQYHAVFKGRGMSFDSVREYQPGDDVRTIDWNVTARTGSVSVKQYVEERELTVLLAVDLSASQDFGTAKRSKRELAAEIAAVLAFSAISNNDRVGLVLFTDRIERYIPPKKGRAHVLRVILELLQFKPIGSGTRLDVACDYLTRIARKRAVVFVLSDFLGPDPTGGLGLAFERALGVTARRHDLVPIVMSDKAERQWPDLGLIPLEDAETGELIWFDGGSAEVRQQFWQRASVAKRKREQAFRKHGLEPIDAVVGQDYLKDLVTYFRRRAARQ
jgi:uncharacterized protein (DUF58 family)